MANDLVREIISLKNKKDAIILAHNYQRAEIQEIADYTGDSLMLSRKAAETEKEMILFCGVDFMAETAKVLAPQKQVLLPVKDAFCPMAEMASKEDLLAKKQEFPDAAVVSYVNTSAEIKAASDICCTSSNAKDIVENIEADQILFLPDINLGSYLKDQVSKEIILWEGYCRTHHRVRDFNIEKIKQTHPNAPILAHPECRAEVLTQADFIGSTAQIIAYAKKSTAEKMIIGTEMGILHSLKQNSPNKTFYLLDSALVCQNMKKISLKDLFFALKEERYQIEVEAELRSKAKQALDKMFQLTS